MSSSRLAGLYRTTFAVTLLAGGIALAQQRQIDVASALPNGAEIQSGAMLMRLTAITDSILRVRIGLNRLPEDASWAVSPEVRNASADVQPTPTMRVVAFHTKALNVNITRKQPALTVTDPQGNVLWQDAPDHLLELRPDGSFTIWKQLLPDEHFFGLGDTPGPLDRRNEAFTLWNTDASGWQESTDPLYKSIPFFMGFSHGRAYGIFLDNTWRSSFDFGKADRNAISFGAEGGPLDFYILAGPTPKDVLRQYAFLSGAPPLPPRWAFGYQQSRWSYSPEAKVREIAGRLRADKIPSDVIWLDIDYQDRYRPFTVDKQRFPDMPRLIADLKAQGFHVVAIADPHIAYTPQYPSYAPYQTGAKQDAFVHNPDGSVYVGNVWPGPSVFPDFTQQTSREWFGSLYQQFVNWGFGGFWDDMNEPSIFNGPDKTMPLDTLHRINDPPTGFATRTATHREIHNVYGMENTRATYEALRKFAPGERPFVMTRASYAGGQRYAVTWTGDNSSTWNHLRQTTPQLENLGLSGFPFSGADVGGFAGSPQPDLLEKWLEIAAFQPIDRDHTQKDTRDQEPWVNGPEREAAARKYIELRYKLLPYIYTAAEETSRTGVPLLRPLFVEFPNAAADGHPLDLDAGGEFLWGGDLLIAPAPFPEQTDSYPLILPSGGWYDFGTGKKLPAMPAKLTPDIAEVPVYVRAGAIIPMEPLTQSTLQTPQDPLTLRVYPGPDCRGSVYWDDGHTLAYHRGEFFRQQFTCEAEENAVRVRLGKPSGSYEPWWKQMDIVILGQNAVPTQVTDGSGNSLESSFDLQAGAIHVLLPASAEGGEVRIQTAR